MKLDENHSLKLEKNDLWIIEWYRTLISNGKAVRAQQLLVEMYDENRRLEAEIKRLRDKVGNPTNVSRTKD